MATSALRDAKADPKGAVRQDPKRQDPKSKHGEASDAEPAAPRRKKRTWLKVTLLLLVLAVGGAGAAWYFLQGQPAPTPKPGAKGAPAKAVAAVSTNPPAFLPMDAFTVNLQQESDSQYLQVGLTLKLTDPGYGESIKLRMPEIRNRILLLLSSKKASELNTLEGKKTLSDEILREVLQSLGGSVPAGGISGVLFTSFLIQ